MGGDIRVGVVRVIQGSIQEAVRCANVRSSSSLRWGASQQFSNSYIFCVWVAEAFVIALKQCRGCSGTQTVDAATFS